MLFSGITHMMSLMMMNRASRLLSAIQSKLWLIFAQFSRFCFLYYDSPFSVLGTMYMYMYVCIYTLIKSRHRLPITREKHKNIKRNATNQDKLSYTMFINHWQYVHKDTLNRIQFIYITFYIRNCIHRGCWSQWGVERDGLEGECS